MHEYMLDWGGIMRHRWTKKDGSKLPDGSSTWKLATDEQLAIVACYGYPHEVAWMEARGVRCENLLERISMVRAFLDSK